MVVEVDEATVTEYDAKTRDVTDFRLLGKLLNVEEFRLNEIQRMYQESDQKKEMLRYWLQF